MKHSFLRGATIISAGLLAFASLEAVASAAACPTSGALYVTGSSAVEPFLKELAARLSTVTVVYQKPGSCVGVNAVNTATPADLTGTAFTYSVDPSDATKVVTTSCDVPAGVKPDIGVSDVFATTCIGVTSLSSDVGDYYGPNQIMTFVVPGASSQTVISSDAAYLLWGFGIGGEVAPWTVDENLLFRRSEASGTQSMLSAAINAFNTQTLPANKWKGIGADPTTMKAFGSGDVLAKVAGSTNPEATIGILATDVADKNRAGMNPVKILAYQHSQQLAGYWPDSKPTALDKINVRDGHYPVWGPLHFFAKKDSTGKPVNAAAKTFIGYFTGEVATPAGVDLVALESKTFDVPQCAMYVTRSSELGDYSDYNPTDPCHCAFEKAATGTTSCKACTSDTECGDATKKCSHGYCEAK
jgi:ABC-type phosphate transport system substrate-binding protein